MQTSRMASSKSLVSRINIIRTPFSMSLGCRWFHLTKNNFVDIFLCLRLSFLRVFVQVGLQTGIQCISRKIELKIIIHTGKFTPPHEKVIIMSLLLYSISSLLT